jgi:hypothetical protein
VAKIALINRDTGSRDVGNIIFRAWGRAIEEARETKSKPVIDREWVMGQLHKLFDASASLDGKKRREVVFDVVYDQDLDDTTRLVWICIPTPDTEIQGGDDTWEKWKASYYDNLSDKEKEEKEKALGTACLFGCGR